MCIEREVKNDGRKKSLGSFIEGSSTILWCPVQEDPVFKKILACLYKECLSEYKGLSLKEIYDRLDTDPTSNKMVSQNVEDLKIPDSKVCYDLLFKAS